MSPQNSVQITSSQNFLTTGPALTALSLSLLPTSSASALWVYTVSLLQHSDHILYGLSPKNSHRAPPRLAKQHKLTFTSGMSLNPIFSTSCAPWLASPSVEAPPLPWCCNHLCSSFCRHFLFSIDFVGVGFALLLWVGLV